ncbi:MAG: WD40 repeat domain-containing protein [Bacteroidota bacterium]
MVRFWLFLTFVLMSLSAFSQECYTPLLAKGDAFAKKGQYEKAINMYLAAMNCPEREVGDGLTEKIQQALDSRVRQLEKAKEEQRIEADNRRLAQIAAEAAKRQATKKAREAMANEFVFKAQTEPDRATAFRLAEHAHRIDPDNPKVLQVLLDLTKPQKETELLPRVLHSPTGGGITSAKISPDGSKLLTSNLDGHLALWDAQTGEIMHVINADQGSVNEVAWSPNGLFFASGGSNSAKVWDARSLELKQEFRTAGNVFSIDFSPNGEIIATASDNYFAEIHEFDSGERIKLFPGLHTYVDFSKDGNQLLTASWLREINVWDANSFELISKTSNASLKKPSSLKKQFSAIWSTDESIVLTTSIDGKIRLHDPINFEQTQAFPGPTVYNTAAFSPDGTKLAIVDESKRAVRIIDLLTKKELFRFHGHLDNIMEVNFSPASDKIISASLDGTARIWNLTTKTPRWTISSTPSLFIDASVSPDGKLIATAEGAGIVKVWDLSSHEELFSLKGPKEKSVQTITFSPDGNYIGASYDKTAIIWDITSKKEIAVSDELSSLIVGIDISKDNKIAILATLYDDLIIWDIETQHQSEISVDIRVGERIEDIAYSSNGDFFAAGASKSVVFWEVLEGKLQNEFRAYEHINTVTAIDFNHQNNRLVSCDQYEIKIWEFNDTGGDVKTIRRLSSHWFTDVEFSPSGQHILSTATDKTIMVLDAETLEFVDTLTGHTRKVTGAAWSPDGETITSWSQDNTIRKWDRTSGQEKPGFNGLTGELSFVVTSADSKYLLTGQFDDMKAKLWDLETQKVIEPPFEENDPITCGAFSPDSKLLATSGNRGNIKIWDLERGSLLYTLENPGSKVYSLAFSDDMKKLAAGVGNKVVKIYNLETREPIESFRANGFPERHLFFTADGRKLFYQDQEPTTGSTEPIFNFYDLDKSKKNDQRLDYVNGFCEQLAMTKDGDILTRGDKNGKLSVWDISIDREVNTLLGHDAKITVIDYSPDDSKILTCSEDGNAKIWDTETGQLLLTLIGEDDKILDGFFHSTKPLVYIVYSDKIQKWWLDGEELIKEFTSENHVPYLTPELMEKFRMYESFQAADLDEGYFIQTGDKELMLSVARYFMAQSYQIGTLSEREKLQEMAAALFLESTGNEEDFYLKMLEAGIE